MSSFRHDWPKVWSQPLSLEVFPVDLEDDKNVKAQPANGRGNDKEDALMVLEVSRKMDCDNCSALGLTTLYESGTVPILLIICQVLVVLFMSVDPIETTAGML